MCIQVVQLFSCHHTVTSPNYAPDGRPGCNSTGFDCPASQVKVYSQLEDCPACIARTKDKHFNPEQAKIDMEQAKRRSQERRSRD
jgi:hypothetical protein